MKLKVCGMREAHNINALEPSSTERARELAKDQKENRCGLG